MLVIIVRSIIIFVMLVVGMRLMGKRTIGELQPYEFVITLAIADLACTPMQNISVPIFYGLIPLAVLFIMHFLITTITSKSIRFRKFANGNPVIVIDDKGINSQNLSKINMDVNDLLELIRQQGYFAITEIKFAIIETNGKVSIMPNEEGKKAQSIPIAIIEEGKIIGKNFNDEISEDKLNEILRQQALNEKEVQLFTFDCGSVFIQPYNRRYIVLENV